MADATTGVLVAPQPPDPTRYVVAGFLAGYKGRTREAYTTDLRLWARFCGDHELPMLGVQRAHIELFARQEEERGLMNSSVARRLGTIRSFYKYAYLEDYIPKDPAAHVRKPRVPQESTTNGLDRNELSAFIATATAMGVKEHALACLLGLNGLRVSELCSLNIEDLSTERGHAVITFMGKGDKPAKIPLAPRTSRAIMLQTGDRISGPVFLRADGNRLDRHAARRVVKRICRKAGITKRISPHSLRHSSITAALDAGVPLRDVQDFARHADPRTTTRYDRGRQSLDRNATYIISAFVAPGG